MSIPRPVLRTASLRLEPLGPEHAEILLAYEVRNREHLAPWEPARTPEYFTLAYQTDAIARTTATSAASANARYVAFAQGREEIVAAINLWAIRRGIEHSAILGYSVDVHAQGRGYATEAGRAVVDYAFGVLNLHRLETSYQPNNEASGRVLRKLGFTVEGYARDYRFFNGAWRDGILVGLTNTQWRLTLPNHR